MAHGNPKYLCADRKKKKKLKANFLNTFSTRLTLLRLTRTFRIIRVLNKIKFEILAFYLCCAFVGFKIAFVVKSHPKRRSIEFLFRPDCLRFLTTATPNVMRIDASLRGMTVWTGLTSPPLSIPNANRPLFSIFTVKCILDAVTINICTIHNTMSRGASTCLDQLTHCARY